VALDERMDSRVTTAGQRHHSLAFDAVTARIRIRRRGHGRPRPTPPRPGRLLGDKAYSRPAIRSHLRRRRIKTTIPERADQQANQLRRGHNGGRPPKFEPEIYKQRNTIERAINKLKGYLVGPRHRTQCGPVGADGEGSPIWHFQGIVNPSKYTRKRCQRSYSRSEYYIDWAWRCFSRLLRGRVRKGS
jgi:Transposase DDE domain